MSAQSPQGYAQHPAMGEVAYRVDRVSPDPDFQVAQTIEMMRRYALEDRADPYLLIDAEAAAWPDPISGVWRVVTQRMKFFEDEENAAGMPIGDDELVEVLIRPRDVARTQGCYGDCDDFAMYTVALLESLGIPSAFCTIAAEPEDPSRYSHVYAVAYVPMTDGSRMRVPMDTSHGRGPGSEAALVFRKREWPVSPNGCSANVQFISWLSLGLSLWSAYEIAKKSGWL